MPRSNTDDPPGGATPTHSPPAFSQAGTVARWIRSNRVRVRLWIAAATAGLVALAAVPALSWISLDLAFLVRPTSVPPEALIVAMDLPSHIDLKQNPEERWSRALHARLIEQLAAAEPLGIVFDATFIEPGIQGAQADVALVEAARRFGKVAVAAAAIPLAHERASGYQVLPPFDPLRSSVAWGPTRFPEDDVARVSPPQINGTPTLSRVVLRMLGRASEGAATTRFGINFYGPPGSLPRVSYASVLRGEIPKERVRGRIVFVGADYKGPFPVAGVDRGRTGIDSLPIPHTRFTGVRAAGVEIVATEVLNLWRGETLRRWPLWMEAAVCLIVATILVFLLTCLPTGRAVLAVAGSGIIMMLTGLFLPWLGHTWFPWMIPCLIQVPVAMALRMLPSPLFDKPPSISISPVASETPVRLPAPRRRALHPAMLVIPDYTLLREIGRGSYGSVWLGRDTVGVVRAVKVVQRDSFSDEAPYLREFQGIQRYSPVSLGHPCLMPILHVSRDETQGFFYYVMEAADDLSGAQPIRPETYQPRTLARDLDRRPFLETVETVELGVALAGALGFLHGHQLVHRDVKPDNVLYVRGQPRLGDLGLVTQLADRPRAVSQFGTPDYLPDEGPGTIAADVYSLGKLLYVAVTGLAPSRFPELPTTFDQRTDLAAFKRLNRVLLQACDPVAERRFASMALFVAALEEAGR
ncbi:MAG: CHASE2 domain-containing protein [Verrucomicrobiales bacterium]|nr:CHASE2 domain-containing protein [Verrucomicrobiales bacterium]